MSEQAPERPGGKKILGMPRTAVIVGMVTFTGALVYFVIKRRQSATQQAQQPGGTDYAGEISTLQSEFGDLASEISAMQGEEQAENGKPPPPGPPPGPPPPPRPHRCRRGQVWDAQSGRCLPVRRPPRRRRRRRGREPIGPPAG